MPLLLARSLQPALNRGQGSGVWTSSRAPRDAPRTGQRLERV